MSVRCRLRPVTAGRSHFVGFHDVTPWNRATDELVCLATDLPEDRLPASDDAAAVVVVDEEGTARDLATTRAWNWQKAARQQFVPALGRRIVAFNDATDEGFCTRILDIETGGAPREIMQLPRALYEIAPDGSYGLSVDMVRLASGQAGYGYAHQSAEPEAYAKTGIVRVDVASGVARNILPMADFLDRHGISVELGLHFFTHIQIAPDGRHYAFVHRCYLANGGLLNNLVVADALGGESRIMHDDKVSHFDWEGPDAIVAWCRQNAVVKAMKESRLKAIARPLYRLSRRIRSNAVRQGVYNEAFRRIDIRTGRKSVIGRGVLMEDGHPQVHPRYPELWVNDTYPTPDHIQTLMLFHAPSGRRMDIASLATQPSIQETVWRCDLHPRWKPAGDKVCVDSAHQGRRQVCVIDVADLVSAISEHP